MSRFNNLKRGKLYTFAFTGGLPVITGIFHEILPDGCLVVGREGQTHLLNPDNIAHAMEK